MNKAQNVGRYAALIQTQPGCTKTPDWVYENAGIGSVLCLPTSDGYSP